ncbi:hypothetical protein [Zwartia panacis]|jgi:hypothetical protein|uniref:hypothetical protein n=1 Tax=Zwartia panacis TaxID=2683345 RepID=UPI0025B343D1|nr:hypothetical protein [Zwartia panacis]MDN4015377.1 hypothetical protein [Zwartia panacis]
MVIRVQAKRAIFKPAPYDTRRGSRGLPGWLILFLIGILLGGGGVLFLQASYGEKRLSLAETQKLTEELKNLTVEKQTLQTKVDESQKVLDAEISVRDTKIKELTSSLSTAESLIGPLREQLNLFAQTLPFDPRYGPIGVSTSLFTQGKNSTKLSYLVWLLQENAQKPEFKGWLELSFEGRYANGRVETITLPRIAVKLNHFLHVTGTTDLPAGFTATRANAKVIAEDGKRQVTWRVLPVQVK